MKPIQKIVALVALTLQFSCGRNYTCDCTQNRFEYNAAGTDSTLISSKLVSSKRGYTKHSAEQKCFSASAKERSIYTTSQGNRGVTSTTCVVY